MKKILVIDDDAMNLKMADYILRQNPEYEILTASSGGQGVSMLKQDDFDLVLLDINMPILNGIGTLKLIRADQRIANIKVIILSASGHKEDVLEAMQLGAVDFIKKPFFPADLVDRVENAFSAERKDMILVVDDDNMTLHLAKKLLGMQYQVELAPSGGHAVAFLQKQVPDLVLLDLHMPAIGGMEVFERIKDDDRLKDVPVIFLTADTDDETEINILKAGATDYIAKPFVGDIVRQRIEKVLETRHIRDSLQETVEQNEKELKESRRRFTALSTQVMTALANAIDAKDRYTHEHSMRVAKYAREIARRMGKSPKEVEDIFYVGLLHDVGKISIPDSIINKPTKLTPEEYEVVKNHAIIGSQILSSVTELPGIKEGARWHHERYDGGGYPDGLVRDKIPEIARIIGVADAYDAMTSRRSFRDALPQVVVRDEFFKGRGTQFDPRIADIMIAIISEDTEYNYREK